MDQNYYHPYYVQQSLSKELCFKNNMSNGFQKEPFHLYIRPDSYYSSQLSGLKPNEKLIFQNMESDRDLICIIFEMVSFQIRYSNHLTALLHLIQQKSLNEFSSLSKNFNPKLENYHDYQLDFAKQSKQVIIQYQNDQLFQNYFVLLLKQVNSFDLFKGYNHSYKKNENILKNFSLSFSPEILSELNGQTILQVLSSVKMFIKFYIDSVQKMIDLLDQDNPYRSQLLQFTLAFQAMMNQKDMDK